eukprot:TRINITY_DN13015_c0_g1_i6.p3 TRINITY_DN13015_c0_g1~~TRINITY_DN13015_c0_g1_i6.p3  ORF type:complete len:108 (+),score=1.85 TRINITY_DN13015_c0_g1_i6:1351-1674(+)
MSDDIVEQGSRSVHVPQTRKANVAGKVNEAHPFEESMHLAGSMNNRKTRVGWISKMQQFINKTSALTTKAKSNLKTERKQPSFTAEKILTQSSLESSIRRSYGILCE